MTASATIRGTGPTPAARHATTRARLVTVAGAVLAAVVVWLAAVPLLGTELAVTQPGRPVQPVGPGMVIGAALAAALAAWGLLAILERLTRRARVVWTSVALVALALSVVPPLISGTTSGGKVALALMHLAVAAVLVPGLGGARR
jgi:Family of unknown function (DUF6069)